MRPIKKGSTDQSVVIRIVDSGDGTPETGVEHNTSGIDLWYRREGATKTSITEAALSALNDAHSDGGIEHIGDGYYRLDLPDAAVASGANGVMVGGTVTGMVVIGCYIPLVDYDPQDAAGLGLSRLDAAVTTRSSHAAADVWSVGTRILTAGTNIALAKGTGVTGFNDLDAAGVRSAVGMASANMDAQITALAGLISALNNPSAATIAAAVLAAGDIDGYTLEEAGKLILAAAAAKLAGAETDTVTIRAADDSKDRITATVDENGNRTAVTLDASG